MYGVPMLGAIIWWIVSARHWFKGPKVNIEHVMLGRDENVIQGRVENSDSEDSSANSLNRETRDLSDRKAAGLA